MISESRLDSIFSRVVYDGGCWLWLGALCDGYGMVSIGGKDRKPHRLVYEALVGPVPDGHVLDHLCRNRACCNPMHIEVVTNAENIKRGLAGRNNADKTSCANGHPYDERNTRMVYRPDGSFRCRRCRACEALWQRDRGRS
jgi:hypothetical protein